MTESYLVMDHRTKQILIRRANLKNKKEKESLIIEAKRLGRRWTIFSLTTNRMVYAYNNC